MYKSVKFDLYKRILYDLDRITIHIAIKRESQTHPTLSGIVRRHLPPSLFILTEVFHITISIVLILLVIVIIVIAPAFLCPFGNVITEALFYPIGIR